jgi:2-haloacid dehalogenase
VTRRLDTVVFDLGGVLIDWDPRHLYRELFADEDEMESFLAEVCSMDWHRRFDAGRPIADGIAELVDRYPDHEAMIRAYGDRWQDMFAGEVPGSVAVLEELGAAGVRLLAITNWPGETFPAARERFPFLGRFEGVVVSGDEGVTKPDPRLFGILMDRHGVDPSGSLFVDDAPANVEAAAALGFATERFTDASALRARLVRERLLRE